MKQSPSTHRGLYWLLIAALSVLLPCEVHAISVEGKSTTYLQTRESADSDFQSPIFEYIELKVQNLAEEDISVNFGGWFKRDLAGTTFDRKTSYDLQYGYLQWNNRDGNMGARAGRFYVFEGVSAGQVDGVYGRMTLPGSGRVSIYVGSPVADDSDGRGGDFIGGARASYGGKHYDIGISYLNERNDSSSYREEAGLDVWARPSEVVSISGHSFYNIDTSGFMDHSYYFTAGPFSNISLRGEVSRISYRHYFSATNTPVFSFRPGVLDKDEKLLLAGLSADWAINDLITATVTLKHYDYDVLGNAVYYGAGVRYDSGSGGFTVRPSQGAGLAIHRMDGDTETLSYTEIRLYGFRKFGIIDTALDIVDVVYDEPRNGVDNAYSLSASCGYDLKDNMRLDADVEYGHNPDFDSELRAMLKFIYLFGTTGA